MEKSEKRPAEAEALEKREKANAYHRTYQKAYRKNHPDKIRKWRDAYIIRRAARLQAQDGGQQPPRSEAEQTPGQDGQRPRTASSSPDQ